MKTEKIIWGMIFIFIGSMFMLDNFNVINFYWGSVWRLWPIIFILIGANMLFSRLENKTLGPVIAASITFVALSFIAYQGTKPRSGRSWRQVDIDTVQNAKWNSESSFSEPFTATKSATLNIEGGATVYKLSDSTSNLFDAIVKEPNGGYTLNRTTIDSAEVLNFTKRDRKGKGFDMGDMESNETHIKLNNAPEWDINVEMGAGETNFELEDFKVRNLKFQGGAASFRAKIGSKLPQTNVVVETGVASVEIEVPESSGCRITVDSGLSSKDFSGFDKQPDGSYKTRNYGTAVNKINISLRGGLSSFEVSKY